MRSHGPRAANSHRKKKEAKKNKDKAAKKESIPEAPKISSYDYRAWDRFDVVRVMQSGVQYAELTVLMGNAIKGSGQLVA